MWCPQCGQEVPGVTLSMSGRMTCARCGGPLGPSDAQNRRGDGLADAAAHGVDLGAPSGRERHSRYEQWRLDQQVRDVQAKAGRWHRVDQRPAPPMAASPPHSYSYPRRGRSPKRGRKRARPPRRSSFIAWAVLSLGLTAFACGAALLVVSLLEQRQDLWNIGIPVAVGGQVGLLLGLALQLERIWQNSRDAVRKLDEVDTQLCELERTTSLMHVTHGSAAQAFYAHMAHDASPELLLADLKGQLDLLAEEVARRR
jgi:hypothetical protein